MYLLCLRQALWQGTKTVLWSRLINQSISEMPIQSSVFPRRYYAAVPAIKYDTPDHTDLLIGEKSTSSQEIALRSAEETALAKENAEIHAEIRRIAMATSLESPRLFASFGVGRPLVGELAPIRPREHRWVAPLNGRDAPFYKQLRNKRPSVNFHAFLFRKRDFTLRGARLWLKRIELRRMREDQAYDQYRVSFLGPELAAAQFFVHRGARVKFHGVDKWYSVKEGTARSLPDRMLKEAHIEAIDATGLPLLYEGMDHFIGLRTLKYLSLKNCPNIDDWCLPKLFILSKTLAYLDLSGCSKVSERGLACLYHLTNLRTLVLDNMPNVQNKELVALLLEDELPLCEVEGVEYNQPPPVYLSPVEQRALEEEEWKKKDIPLLDRVADPSSVEVGNKAYQLAYDAALRKKAQPKEFLSGD